MRAVFATAQDSPDASASPSRFDKTREAIIERCPKLEDLSSRAVDITARFISALHAAVNGHATDYAGFREPDYLRKQLRGEAHPITAEDLGWLGEHAPAELLEGIRVLLGDLAALHPEATANVLARVAPLVGCVVEPQKGGSVGDALDASAALMDEAVAAGTALVRDARDGRVDEPEAHLARLQRVKVMVVNAEASIRGRQS